MRKKQPLLSSLKKPINYSGSDYGLFPTLTGKGVKIAILDSGVPVHTDLPKFSTSVDMTSESSSKKDSAIDRFGHSTMIAGVLVSKNTKTITGICPDAELLFAKIVDSSGKCKFQYLLAGILWAIVKKSDIILISLGSDTDYPVLKDAIDKATREGISVIAASGKESLSYPSKYENVLSVESKKKSRRKNSICINGEKITTTFLDDKYIIGSGSSLSASFAAGIAALIIENKKNNKEDVVPHMIYSEIKKTLSKG